MRDGEPIDKNLGRSKVLDDRKICLSQSGGSAFSESGFRRTMYMDLPEVLELIKTLLQEASRKKIEYFRTVESGAFEEYVVIEKEGGSKSLLFRAWPVLFAHNKRLEYKIYEKDQNISKLITYYLGICARTNNATLVLKE